MSCGGQLELTPGVAEGRFSSPNYPNNYPPNVDCVWVITAPPTERVQLDFDDDFEIETAGRYVEGLFWGPTTQVQRIYIVE